MTHNIFNTPPKPKSVYDMSDDELTHEFLMSSLSLNQFLGMFPAKGQEGYKITQEQKDNAKQMVKDFREGKLNKDKLPTINSCSNCGSAPSFTHHMSYGHGDSGFSGLRLKCNCGISIGDGSNYGTPTDSDKKPIIELWNKINKKQAIKNI